jgi:hypothetical protein
MHPIIPPDSAQDRDDEVSDFDLHALAFADLIERELNGETAPDAISAPLKRPPLPAFTSIRCICGKNENIGDLMQCHDCHCFLHAACIDRPAARPSAFRCPFCRIGLDAIDPFQELTTWIDIIANELKVLHSIATDAVNIEHHLAEFGSQMPLGDYSPYMVGPRSNQSHLRTSLAVAVQDLEKHINILLNQ